MRGAVFSLSLSLSTDAASTQPLKCDNLRVIPPAYTADGKSQLVLENDETSDYDVTGMVVYGAGMEKLAEITPVMPSQLTLTRWTQERGYAYKNIVLNYSGQNGGVLNIDGRETGISLDEAVSEIRSRYGRADIADMDGETVIAHGYYGEEEYGQKYIAIYFRNVDGIWQEWVNEWVGEDYGPYGDWKEKVYETWKQYPKAVLSLLRVSEYSRELRIPVTQTLFNADDSYEYCVPMYNVADYEEEWESRRSGGQRIVYTGIKVVSHTGATVSEFKLPEGYTLEGFDGEYICVIDLDGERYIGLSAENADDSGHRYVVLFNLGDRSGVRTPIVVKGGMRVSPTAPVCGETVKVELGGTAAQGCKVMLVGVDGIVARSIDVPAGVSAIDVETSFLPRGNYIVTVENGGAHHESSRLIVR